MSATNLRRILVTGANKGIGLAVVRKILTESNDTFVYLGARDAHKGSLAKESLMKENSSWGSRIDIVLMDVGNADSVVGAASGLRDTPLYALVNNAGIQGRPEEMFNVNFFGLKRCVDAFLPNLKLSGGEARIVNVSSGAAPMFVEKCTPARLATLISKSASIDDIVAAANDFLSLLAAAKEDGGAAMSAAGYPRPDPNSFFGMDPWQQLVYGASKAFVNSYTVALAASFGPASPLTVNACTPGFIATDMTKPLFESIGKSATEAGAQPVEAGTRAILFLLFGQPGGSGWYFGSDAVRSPMHKYRAPGTPAYTDE